MNNTRWMRAVSQVLLAAERPLSAEEIANRAISQHLIQIPPQCPAASVTSIIRTHVQHGNDLLIESTKVGRLKLYSIESAMRNAVVNGHRSA